MATIATVVDAGPLYAYVDPDDRYHRACIELFENHPGPLFVPQLVIAEVAYFIGSRLGSAPEVRFLADLVAGTFIVEPVLPTDWQRIAELVWRYRDLPLGTEVDSEQLGIPAQNAACEGRAWPRQASG